MQLPVRRVTPGSAIGNEPWRASTARCEVDGDTFRTARYQVNSGGRQVGLQLDPVQLLAGLVLLVVRL